MSIQGTYHKVEVSLFSSSDCIDTISQVDVKASSHLIPMMSELLDKHGMCLSNLSFLAVDHGPGAFTSLRVTLATINGIVCARHLPIVGVSGLEAFAAQVYQANLPVDTTSSAIIILLNAYNSDVYFYVARPGHDSLIGCKNIHEFIEDTRLLLENVQIVWAGNGVTMHQESIINAFSPLQTHIYHDPVGVCSAQSIGMLAYPLWLAGAASSHATPYYLKTQLFAVRT